MENFELRAEARKWAIPLWMIADRLGISEATMTRRLRRELPLEETARIMEIIRELAAERRGEDEG